VEPDEVAALEVANGPDEPLPPRRVLVVPTRPGPLRPFEAAATPDELDELVDDIFGGTTDERPGPFDLLLFVGGIALLGWGWLTGGLVLVALGAVGLVLGLALPVRQLVASANARRTADRRRRLVGAGLLLDADDAATGGLVEAYGSLVRLSDGSTSPMGADALTAGHAAVREVASLLGGRRPATDAERAYVGRRTEAMRNVTASLLHSGALRGTDGDADLTAPDSAARVAVVQARELLEADTGVGAVDELQRLDKRLRADGPADGR